MAEGTRDAQPIEEKEVETGKGGCECRQAGCREEGRTLPACPHGRNKVRVAAQRSPSGTPQFSLPELCTANAAHKGNEAPEGNELALPASFQHRVLQQWEPESDPDSVLLRGRSLFDNTVRFQNKHQENKAR